MRTILNLLIVAALAVTGAGVRLLAGGARIVPAGLHPRDRRAPVHQPDDRTSRWSGAFTERVRTEFIGRGRYQVLPQEAGVDAVLRGAITGLSIVPGELQRRSSRPRATSSSVTTKIEFVDLKTNKTLWENPSMVFREEYDLPADTQAGNPSAFFGQGVERARARGERLRPHGRERHPRGVLGRDGPPWRASVTPQSLEQQIAGGRPRSGLPARPGPTTR